MSPMPCRMVFMSGASHASIGDPAVLVDVDVVDRGDVDQCVGTAARMRTVPAPYPQEFRDEAVRVA